MLSHLLFLIIVLKLVDRNYAAVQEAVNCATLTLNFENQDITANETVTSCGDINIQNVTVSNGIILIFDASGNINVENVYVSDNSRLVLDAGSKVSLGAGLTIKQNDFYEKIFFYCFINNSSW